MRSSWHDGWGIVVVALLSWAAVASAANYKFLEDLYHEQPPKKILAVIEHDDPFRVKVFLTFLQRLADENHRVTFACVNCGEIIRQRDERIEHYALPDAEGATKMKKDGLSLRNYVRLATAIHQKVWEPLNVLFQRQTSTGAQEREEDNAPENNHEHDHDPNNEEGGFDVVIGTTLSVATSDILRYQLRDQGPPMVLVVPHLPDRFPTEVLTSLDNLANKEEALKPLNLARSKVGLPALSHPYAIYWRRGLVCTRYWDLEPAWLALPPAVRLVPPLLPAPLPLSEQDVSDLQRLDDWHVAGHRVLLLRFPYPTITSFAIAVLVEAALQVGDDVRLLLVGDGSAVQRAKVDPARVHKMPEANSQALLMHPAVHALVTEPDPRLFVESVAAIVPSLLVSTGPDEFAVLDSLVAAGVALAVDVQDSASHITSQLQLLLTAPQFTHRVRQLQTMRSLYDSPQLVASFVLEIAHFGLSHYYAPAVPENPKPQLERYLQSIL